jgi:hypothetical protein
MTAAAAKVLSPAEIAFAYHKRTKHSLGGTRPAEETLDWDDQPKQDKGEAPDARV